MKGGRIGHLALDVYEEEEDLFFEDLSDRVIRDDVFTLEDGRVIRATCSIGFACFPFVRDEPDTFSWEDVLALADSALYAAKHTSRDAWVGLVSTNDTFVGVNSFERYLGDFAPAGLQLQ